MCNRHLYLFVSELFYKCTLYFSDYIFKVILYSYLILKKMNERIIDS